MIRLMLKNEAGEELEILEDVTKLDFTDPNVWAFVAGAIAQTLYEVGRALAEIKEEEERGQGRSR